MKNNLKFIMLSAAALLMPATLPAVSVTLTSDFTGGLYGNFNLQYDSPAAGLQLQSVTFDLQSPLYTDPTFTSPGALLPFPFVSFGGAADTGFVSVVGAADGSTSFDLLFSDFDAGESFNFELDIDGPCGGFLCIPGATTLGSEFAGTKMTATFSGIGYKAATLEGVFLRTGQHTAAATVTGDVTPTPEPATMGLLGACLVVLAVRAKSRRRA
jgi:hypothetical protein